MRLSDDVHRHWGGYQVFSGHPLMELAHLADIPDPNTFEQPDAQYEVPDAIALLRRMLQDSPKKSQLWCSKYQPSTYQDVCGHKNWASFVHTWLGKWRDAMMDSSAPHAKSKKSSYSSAEQDDYDFSDMDDDSVSGSAKMSNAMLIVGPSGAGKTAAIYACASQLKYNVIEVNPSSDRSGQQIKNLFAEATQSHRASAAAPRAAISKSLGQTSSKDVADGGGVSLILFEEVDNLFPEYDKGFFQALNSLLEDSKRPILMTCETNHIPKELKSRAHVAEWPMVPTSPAAIFVLLNLMLLCEDQSGASKLSTTDAEVICQLFNRDMRRAINAAELAFQTSAECPRSFAEVAAGLSPFVGPDRGALSIISGSSLHDLQDVIAFSDIRLPRRSAHTTKLTATLPLAMVVHLNWLSRFSFPAVPDHDKIFVVDHDPFVYREVATAPAPLSSASTIPLLFKRAAEQVAEDGFVEEDKLLASKLDGVPIDVVAVEEKEAPAVPFELPAYRLTPKNKEGALLFDSTIVEISDAWSVMDLLCQDSGAISHFDQLPLPATRHHDMLSSYLAHSIKSAVARLESHSPGDTAAIAQHHTHWASKSHEDIVQINRLPALGALWRFVPPLITSRSLERDYLPSITRMCFLEEKRKQLNTKRRFQERMQLRSAAVTPLEINLLTLLAQPVSFPTPGVPEDL
jgi:DNA polymerase III delta prime subunit